MTAFNSIKTNNWPAASNDLEDFLVLELPLNDQAALTSSRRDIVAGSTVLHPKRTLTNTGVSSLDAGPNYSALISGSVDSNYPLSNLFGGTIGTSYTNGTRATNPGTLTLTLTSLNITVTNVRLSTYIYNTPSTFTVNGTTVPRGTGNGDKDYVVAVNGQLNTIAWSYDSSSGPYCYMKGIEVDYGDGNGYQLLTDATGGAKKHYDNNATFNGSSTLLLSNSGINLGGDYCVECYFRPTGSIGEHTRVFEFKPANLAFYIYGSNNNTYVQVGSGSSLTGGANTWTIDTWHHFATTRQNGVTRLFIDGVQKGSSGSSTAGLDLDTTINLNGNASGSYRWNGAMQDFRIYNGVAKYTANFTPPGAILG